MFVCQIKTILTETNFYVNIKLELKMSKDINLVAKKTLELIKENSLSSAEYQNNLIKSITLLGDELKKELNGENKPQRNQEIAQYIKEKNGKAIYNIIKAGAVGYDMDQLINAVIEIGDADAILSCVVIWKNKNITKAHFVKCAKALIKLQAVEEIVHFSKYCFGDYEGYNTFNIAHKFVDFMEEDVELMKKIVEHINLMKANQGNTPSCYMPFGTCVTTNMQRFKNMVYSLYLKKEREV